MFVKNCWYVAAWSSEVSQEALFSRVLLNTPVLLWRDAQGQVRALEDRCCHRGAPLSRGRLENGNVRCLYHGLLFNPEGECIQVPAQDRIPPNARVRAFPVVEKTNWIWIWMGDPSLADPASIPDTFWLDDDAWKYREGYLHYGVNYLLVTDNLLDFSHLPYVHPTTVGGDESFANLRPTIDNLANGMRISRWHLSSPPAPFVRKVTDWTDPVDRWNVYDFLVPGILLMHSGSAPANTGAPEGNFENAVEFRSAQAVTPETADSCHYFFSQAHNFCIDDPQVTATIHQILIDAFHEDHAMIHAQQKNLQIDPDFEMVPVGLDAALNRFRWMINKRIEVEKNSASPAAHGQGAQPETVQLNP